MNARQAVIRKLSPRDDQCHAPAPARFRGNMPFHLFKQLFRRLRPVDDLHAGDTLTVKTTCQPGLTCRS